MEGESQASLGLKENADPINLTHILLLGMTDFYENQGL